MASSAQAMVSEGPVARGRRVEDGVWRAAFRCRRAAWREGSSSERTAFRCRRMALRMQEDGVEDAGGWRGG